MTNTLDNRLRRQRKNLLLNIAYTIDYRGDNDDELTFVFRGVPFHIVKTVFDWLGKGHYFFGGAVVSTELDCLRRNGYCHQRVTAKIKDAHTDVISTDNLAELMEARFLAETTCTIKRLTMQRFLNV